MKKLLEEKQLLITKIIIFLTIYLRCDFGIVKKPFLAANLIVDFMGFLLVLWFCFKNKEAAKKSIFNVAILWLVLFAGFEFLYGHFGLVFDTKMYSMQYTIMTLLPALIVYELLWHNKDNLLDLICDAGSAVIIATFITNVCYDRLWIDALHGEFYRLGEVPGGTVIDTGNLYILMLIPITYSLIVDKKIKRYILPSIVGVVGIMLAGSKSSVGPLIVVFAIMMLGAAKDKAARRRSIIIILAVGVVGLISIMTVPILYEVIGSRIVELFTAVDATEYDLHTSTGQRMAVLAAFKAHFWENPIFGHGFYAFKFMPYSQLEEYIENGVVCYRNIQTHMNFMELLFSFGFVGLICYYWFPLWETIKIIKSKVPMAKLLGLSFLITFLSIDLGLDMFYKYMTPYYTYLFVYILISIDSEKRISQEEK